MKAGIDIEQIDAGDVEKIILMIDWLAERDIMRLRNALAEILAKMFK